MQLASGNIYVAACNPPRRVKRWTIPPAPPQPHSPMVSPATQQRSILPKRSGAQATKSNPPVPSNDIDHPAAPVATPSKRGRKPGPLSRAAREAQRRLNHSIIEKARRTKINEALATLRQLVPVDYGKSGPTIIENDEDSDLDEFQDDKRKQKPKTTGKKEEKEKEFKLEILVRTVSFMQDLLERVDDLEKRIQNCSNCGTQAMKKRKRSDNEERTESIEADDGATPNHPHNRPRKLLLNEASPINETTPPKLSIIPPSMAQETPLLPSISSWLPETTIKPTHISPSLSASSPVGGGSYLPSPPLSTHFDPIRTSKLPPTLSLGPVATAAMLSSVRTADDESAASLLLQISGSTNSARSPSLHLSPSHPIKPLLVRTAAQTPGSLLGMDMGSSSYSPAL